MKTFHTGIYKAFMLVICTLSSSIAFSQNNVGIGTTTPRSAALLDLHADNLGLLLPRVNRALIPGLGANDNGLLVYDTTAGNQGVWYWNGASWLQVGTGAAGWGLTGNAGTNPATDFVGTTDAQALILRSDNIERMRIHSNGNVGIGTATPAERLEVNGNVIVHRPGQETTLRVGLGNISGGSGNGRLTIESNNFQGSSPVGNNLLIDNYVMVYQGALATEPLFSAAEIVGAAGMFGSVTYTDATALRVHAPNAASAAITNPWGIMSEGSIKLGGLLQIEQMTAPGIVSNRLYNDGGQLYWNGTNISGGGSGWGLTGNAGTTDGTNFIGTTDNVPLDFKVNNEKAGRIELTPTTANSFFGYQAGNVNTGGLNTGIGYQALFNNTTGNWNTANGSRALFSNTTGFRNTATGYQALFSNDTGHHNTATGHQALWSNITGHWNTATGNNVLYYNTTGTNNTASGSDALLNNTTGGWNTATGVASLQFNTTGGHNTATGYRALYDNVTGSQNTAIGYNANVNADNLTNATAIGANATVGASNSLVLGNNANVGIGTSTPAERLDVVGNMRFSGALMPGNLSGTAGQVLTSAGPGAPPVWSPASGGWGLTGNAGTNPLTNFIGTTDNNPIRFRVNNIPAGYLGTSDYTFMGYQAGLNNTGGGNTGFGHRALFTVTTAFENTAIGNNAQEQLTTGIWNVAVGSGALRQLTTANYNTAVGTLALTNVLGNWSNTAIGSEALQFTKGSGNIGIGRGAGEYDSLGDFNTYVGFASGPDTSLTLVNATAIGAFSKLKQSNTVILGQSANVGIGTSLPSEKLEVVGNMRFSGALMPGNLSGTAGQVLTSAGPGAPPVWSPASGGWGLTGNAGVTPANFLGTTDNRGLRFRTGNTERMILDSLGRLGIGTGSPMVDLQVGDRIGLWRLNMFNEGTVLSSNIYLDGGTPRYITNAQATLMAFSDQGSGNRLTFAMYPAGTTGSALGPEVPLLQIDSSGTASIRGGIRMYGTLEVDSDPGAAGDVLVSQGAGLSPVWQAAAPGSGWGLTGNAGTTDGANFIGTTDNVPLNFKVNNEKAGRIDPAGVVLLGYQAGNVNLSTASTAIGHQALFSSIGGIHTAVGYQALFSNTTGNFNTANGFSALYSNTTGDRNTAFGDGSLYLNLSGSFNTAVGKSALQTNTTGSGNTAIGRNTLTSNVTGSNNTALGHSADVTTDGLTNATAIGYNATVGASNSLVLGNNANVGIGTTAPTARLDIIGSIKISDGTQDVGKVLTSDANGLATWETPTSGGWALTGNSGTNPAINFIGTTDAQPLRLATGVGGVERMRIDATGNVGIGTTAPSQRLDVVGNARIGAGTANNVALTIPGPNSPIGAANGQDISYSFSTAGSSRIRSYRGSSWDTYLQFLTNAAVTGSDNPEVRMHISENGNVGIGTTAPFAPLQVAGNLAVGPGANGGNVYVAQLISTGVSPISNRLTFGTDGTGYKFAIARNISGTTTDLMTIQDNGNVGIGTTVPGQMLQVQGGNVFTNGGKFQTNRANAQAATVGGLDLMIDGVTQSGVYTAGSGNMALYTQGTERVRIANNGNVGIGTTTPSSRLQVVASDGDLGPANSGTAATGSLRISGGTNFVALDLGVADDAYLGSYLQSHQPTNMAVNTPLLLNPNGGNVGIGSTATAPTSTFHVSGNPGISTPIAKFDHTTRGTISFLQDGTSAMALSPTGAGGKYIFFNHPSGPVLMLGSNGSEGWVGTSTNHNLIFTTLSTVRMTITATGLTGIGRTPATNPLEVQGDVSKTNAGGWLANSDKRIKTDILDIENSIDLIKALRPVKFKYTDEWMKRNPSLKNQYYYNFIAQEFQQVFPEAVQGSGEYLEGDKKEILQIDTYNAQIVTIKAVQEQQMLIEDQQKMIEEQQKQIENLKTEVATLNAKNTGAKVVDANSVEARLNALTAELEKLKALIGAEAKKD